MARYLTVINQGEGFDVQDFNRAVAMPKKEYCNPNVRDWLLQDCDKTWSCNKLAIDPAFNMIYDVGDKIQLQFRFADEWNFEPFNPTDGWGLFVRVEWIGNDGTVFSTDHEDFTSRSMVGWDGLGSYQILEVDTQLLADAGYNCFSLQVTSYKIGIEGEEISQTICVEQFGVSGCDSTVKVQGIYNKYDCFNNWYGVPETYLGDYIQYENTLKFDGFLRDSGFSLKKELVNGRSVSSNTRQIWSLTIRKPVPPYVKNTLYGQLLAGQKLLINDEEYTIESAEAEPFGNMFKVQIEVYKECELNSIC